MGAWQKVGRSLFGERIGADNMSAVPIDPELARAQSEARKAQVEGLQSLRDAYAKTSAEDQGASDVAAEKRALQGSLSDTRMRIQQLMAQRGLKNTSAGIQGQAAVEREAGLEINRAQESLPDRIRRIREQRATTLAQAGNAVAGAQGYVPDYYSSARQGFVGSLLGGANAAANIVSAVKGK